MGAEELKHKIINVLKSQGFKVNPHVRPMSNTKAVYKELQQQSRSEVCLNVLHLQKLPMKIPSGTL